MKEKQQLLKEGDIILLQQGHTVYTEIPNHFIYSNRVGDFKNCSLTEVKIGELNFKGIDTSFLIGKYIVVKTTNTGGGVCGHGTNDYYPNGHHVICEKITDKTTSKDSIKVSFYQTGCFTAMIKDIKPIGRATCKWTV
jgi:hypothetical protein